MNPSVVIAIVATFALCEYYNRRVLKAYAGLLIPRRNTTWKNFPKAASRTPAHQTARKGQRFVTESAKTMQNTQYIDA